MERRQPDSDSTLMPCLACIHDEGWPVRRHSEDNTALMQSSSRGREEYRARRAPAGIISQGRSGRRGSTPFVSQLRLGAIAARMQGTNERPCT
jgi:hypothetical protein